VIKVDTSCCSRFHIFDQARQLQKKGLLNNVIHCHPNSHLKKFQIDINKSINNPFLGYLNYVGRYLPNLIDNVLQKYITLETDLFIKKTLIKKKNKPDVFIGLSSFVTQTLEYCNQNNIVSIVDHGSLHPEYEKKIIIKECNKISIDHKGFVAPDWQIQRMNLEFLKAKKIIVHSDIAKKSMINLGIEEKKINVLNSGVDSLLFKSKITKKFDNFTIAFCGSLSPRKGVHNLIEAFKFANINGSKLLIIGAKGRSKDYNQYLKKISTKNVLFYGSVSQSNLSNVLSKCHLFVLPSLADGFGLVVLQAISSGLPVIVSSNVGGADIIQKFGGGDIFQYNNINELTEKIINFYKKKNNLNYNFDLKQVVNNNTWDNYGDKLNNLINKV
jgi:glycosyltransferase involved in cell wall biosynthesis